MGTGHWATEINECVRQQSDDNNYFQSGLLKACKDAKDLQSDGSLCISTHPKWRYNHLVLTCLTARQRYMCSCSCTRHITTTWGQTWSLKQGHAGWGRHSSHNTGRLQYPNLLHPLLRLSPCLPLDREHLGRATVFNPPPQPLPHLK